MAKFSIGASKMSWLALVTGSTGVDYDPKLDPRNPDGSYKLAPEDAARAIVVTQSIGDGGRGSAKLSLSGDAIPDVLGVLENWDPNVAAPETLTTAEIVERTLRQEFAELPKDAPEGTEPEVVAICFKVSLAPHTRELRIPVEHFEGFCAFLRDTFVDNDEDKLTEAVEHYRGEIAKIEAAERVKAEKAAKLAAAAAKASGK